MNVLIRLFEIAFLLSAVLAQENDLTAQTQQGPVTGTSPIPEVRRFLGVPYGVANRWEAPQLPPTRSTGFQATEYGDSCVQRLDASGLEFLRLAGITDPQVPESEDCLSVNIWAPSPSRRQAAAVMIWIYGGSAQFGTSNTIYYDGQNLVRDNDDIVLVTLNYRMNVFGQPNSPQLVSSDNSQNFGLLDVDLAIQWVHANIQNFGGDPNRIVLFGQSAGSGIIDSYSYTHPHDQVVKGIIEQSGSLAGQLSLPVGIGMPLDPTPWNILSTAVGCGNNVTAEQLVCMKKVTFRTLENAVIANNLTFGLVGDGITSPVDANALSAAGNFLRVPLLVGNTAQEGDIFVVEVEQLSLGFDIPVATQLLSDAVTALLFQCPATTTATDRMRAGVPTWKYEYQAIFPDISSLPDLRAYHASEIPIIFGTYNFSTFAAPTLTEIAFSKYVQGAWVAFARDPQQGLINYGWPKYDPGTVSVAQLGNFFNQTGVTFGLGGLLDLNCVVVNALEGVVESLLTILGIIL